MNLFNEMFGYEATPKPTAQATPVPDLPMDDWQWQLAKPANRTGATKIFRDALVEDACGDCPMELSKFTRSDALIKDANDHTVDLMLKAGGKAGRRLQSMMRKLPVSLSEAMYRMVNNFEEFFSAEERKLLQKQIQALDLPGFLEMFNDRVIGAKLS